MFDCTSKGIIRGQIIRPLENIGVYVRGTASYPSSVLMNVLPAKLAGVKKIVMVTPPRAGGIDPHILVAASLAGVDEIYMIGGAQAIAALAYGTESIPKVDKIVGPKFVRRSSETRSIWNSKYRYDCWTVRNSSYC